MKFPKNVFYLRNHYKKFFDMLKSPITIKYVPFWHIDARLNTSRSFFYWRKLLEDIINDDDFPLISHMRYSVTELIVCFNYITPKVSKLQARIRSAYLYYYNIVTINPGPPCFEYEKEIPFKN